MVKYFVFSSKHILWFIVLYFNLTLTSCSILAEELEERIEQEIADESEGLNAAIKNNTPYIIERAEIRTAKITQVYGHIKPNNISQFKSFNSLFNEELIVIKTTDEVFKFTPEKQDNSTKVTDGTFYFEVSLSDKRTLIIKRKPN